MTENQRKTLIDAVKNVHCSNFDSTPYTVKNEIILIVEALTEDFVRESQNGMREPQDERN